MKELRKPARVYLDVTAACQLRCRHCCTSSTHPLKDELSFEEIQGIIEQVKTLGVSNLVISGGEPLLRPELYEILAKARHLDLNVTLLTNGLLIDEMWARRLAELSIRVKISLDGVSAATHDYLRGQGTFAQTLQVLRLLLSEGADTAVHYTVHRRNFLELDELPSLLSHLGVQNLVIGTIKPAGRAVINAELLIPPRMVPFVHARVNTIKKRAGLRIMEFADRGWGQFGCPATCNKLGITANGRLTTCAFFGPELLGGSVREHTLKELWQAHLERRDLFLINEKCRTCPALSRCAGGCRARALYYHGDINAPDPYACALYEKKIFIDRHRRRLLEARQNLLEAFS